MPHGNLFFGHTVAYSMKYQSIEMVDTSDYPTLTFKYIFHDCDSVQRFLYCNLEENAWS